MTSPYYEWIDVGPRFSADQPGYVHKFQRAVTHLNAITNEVGDFIATGLHAPVSGEVEATDDGWIIIRPGAINPAPGVWNLYLGDFLNNARASLDYLVYDLVRANHCDPAKHTAFPICETEGKWKDDITERDTRSRGPSPISGVSKDVQRVIHDEQPLRHKTDKLRKNDDLMHLLRMSNTDKHRRLHISAIETGKVLKVWAEPEGLVEIYRLKAAPVSGGVKSDSEVARVKVRPIVGADPNADVYFGFQRPAEIAFSVPGETRKATMDNLFGIINSIMRIGCRLETYVSPSASWFSELYAGKIGGGHRTGLGAGKGQY